MRDINDNSPRFDTVASGHTVLSILESVAVGSTFLLPSATDPDSPSFGVHRYDIASDSNTLNFNSTPVMALRPTRTDVKVSKI